MRVIDGFISRKELIDALVVWRDHDEYSKKRWFYEKWVRTVGINVLIMAVKNFPAADAVEVVHGWWIDMYEDEATESMWRCSACGSDRYFDILTPIECGCYYCPNCGAKMDKIENM